jgi:hypothetical protein
MEWKYIGIIRMIKSRRMRWAGHVARMGRRGIGYWRERQKERDHWEDRLMWVDNIKTDLRVMGWDGMDWMDTAPDKDR